MFLTPGHSPTTADPGLFLYPAGSLTLGCVLRRTRGCGYVLQRTRNCRDVLWRTVSREARLIHCCCAASVTSRFVERFLHEQLEIIPIHDSYCLGSSHATVSLFAEGEIRRG